jgi:two-component system sensor histidine kinase CpxA
MSALKTSKAFFSSFTLKLFIWFWLIAIISIASTRFISMKLATSSDNPVGKVSSHAESKQLNNIIRRIKRSNINSIKKLQQLADKNPLPIWLKEVNDENNVTNLVPLPIKAKQVIHNYLRNNTFTTSKTYVFPHEILVGPKKIVMQGKHYQLFLSKRSNQRSFGQIVKRLPGWALIAIPTVVSFVLCLLLARSFSKPIRAIKKASTQLGKGDFSTRVSTKTQRNDELGQLANSFNQMAEQLQQHQTSQQRLLGDVSHELRSPMTRLQMALGLAQQDATSPKAKAQYLERCQVEIDRLDQMVGNVLSLSRLENTLQNIHSEKINFNNLLDTIVTDEQFIADGKSIVIDKNFSVACSLNGDRTLLVSAISNVLSNAVKYSPENSHINVNLSKNKHTIVLTILDEGEGVPEESLTQLFSPFYRVNLARDRKTGGTGLGLAIAKQAILAHQGKITAQNRTEDIQLLNAKNKLSTTGLSVTIELPYL